MILFAILLIISLLLVGFIVLVTAVGGAIFTIMFSDVIVCLALIIALMIFLIRRRKR